MTATVTISGTWSEKQRPNNGLDTHAELIRKNRILRVPIVGFVEYHQWTETLTGEKLTVAIPVLEPGIEADGSDPHGIGKVIFETLDGLRKMRGKGSTDDVPVGGQLAGQESLFDFNGADEEDGGEGGNVAETRVGPDGEREVPPPSGEEILAEREEAKLGAKPAKSAKQPAADPFTPGDAA